jgi:hypothetical protein
MSRAVGDVDVLDALLVSQLRRVIGVLEKHSRLVVGVGDHRDVVLEASIDQQLRHGRLAEVVAVIVKVARL